MVSSRFIHKAIKLNSVKSPSQLRYYTWSIDPIRANLEFVPMLWGQNQAQSFDATINNTIAHYKVTAVLGMNEFSPLYS